MRLNFKVTFYRYVMIKFILCSFLLYASNVYAKCDIELKDIRKNLKALDSGALVCNGWDLYSGFSSLNLALLPVGLNSNMFDMSESINSGNINNYGILTTYFWQKNRDTYYKIYVASDISSNRTMVVLSDLDNNVKILGEKDKSLMSAIIKYENFPLELLLTPQVHQAINFFFSDDL